MSERLLASYPSGLRVRSTWDASLYQTTQAVPRAGFVRLLIWDEPGHVDAGPSEAMALALLQSLAAFGELKFRLPRPLPAGLRDISDLPRKNWMSRMRWAVAGAVSPQAALCAFESGWALGEQTITTGMPDGRAATLLALANAQSIELAGEEIVLSAAVDGGAAVLAAAAAARGDAALRDMTHRLRALGFEIEA